MRMPWRMRRIVSAEMKGSAAGKANFLAERSPDFWAGNSYFGATAKIQEWLQKQQPVQTNPDAGAQELEAAQGRKAELWKPIAAKEYETARLRSGTEVIARRRTGLLSPRIAGRLKVYFREPARVRTAHKTIEAAYDVVVTTLGFDSLAGRALICFQ